MATTRPRTPKISDVQAPPDQGDAIRRAMQQLLARQQRAVGVVNNPTLTATPVQRSLAGMAGPISPMYAGMQRQSLASYLR
jgi:hypothetical protein